MLTKEAMDKRNQVQYASTGDLVPKDHLLLAENVDINKEIFIALLKSTEVNRDIAENGLVAVEKFAANPTHYHMIIMDAQMPEMNGNQATRAIRAMDIPQAKIYP